MPLLKKLVKRFGLPVQEGFPVLDDDFAWKARDGSDGITVVGALAAVSMGPAAFNLLGARKGGATVAMRYHQPGKFYCSKKYIEDEFSLFK